MEIEKRLPIGFCGDWAELYKLQITEDLTNYDLVNDTTTIVFNSSKYNKVIDRVQLIELDESTDLIKELHNLSTEMEQKAYKTSDSYFNKILSKYECVISIGDILKIDNAYYICEKIKEKSVRTPKKQSIYYLNLVRVYLKVVEQGEY